MTGTTRDEAHRPHRAGSPITDVALAVVLAVTLLAASMEAVQDSDLQGIWRSAVVALLVGLHAAVAGRSRWPVATFAITSAAMLGLAIAPDLGGQEGARVGGPYSALLLPSALLFFIGLYTVSSRSASPLPQAALAVGLLGAVITIARLWDADDYVTTPFTGLTAWRLLIAGGVTAGVLAAWSLGRYRATRVAWVAALEERAVRAERDRRVAVDQARADLERETERAAAEERRRIAREMHDVVAHSLAVVVGQAEGGRMLVHSEPHRAPEVLATIADQGRRALTEMRSLLGVLRDDGAASTSPQPRLRDLDDLVDEVRRAGTTVDFLETGARQPLSATADLAAFRVVQESLTNVVKHAQPPSATTLTLAWSDAGLRILVRDQVGGQVGGPGVRNGERPLAVLAPVPSPVDPRPTPAPPARGLLGMRERLALVGGQLVHAGPDPTGSGGFLVEAWLPCQAPASTAPSPAAPSDPPTEGATP